MWEITSTQHYDIQPPTPSTAINYRIKNEKPVAQFNIRGNWTNRKFGNSGSYRHVEEAVCYMLGLTATEAQKWIFDFLAPMRETMKAGE